MLPQLAAIVFLAGILPAQQPPEQSPRISSYEIEVELIPDTKTVQGTQIVTWRNTTQGSTQELRFHLYLNAFADQGSTLMQESDAEFRSQWREDEYGWTLVSAARLVDPDGQGDPIELEMGFRHPDDGNLLDQTVLTLQLPRAVQPGESITVEMEFESRMPKAYRRTGWIPGGGFMCFHWYPILGVLEPDGGGGSRWNCHQFHANTEFFADFSVYDVRITVPDDYVVGATGGDSVEVPGADAGKKTLRFRQDDVHNFAFVADPNYVKYGEDFELLSAAEDGTGVAQSVAAHLGVDVGDYDLPSVKIILLMHPEHDTPGQVERHFAAIKVGLEFYGLRYGPYPYQTVTAVDPGRDILGRGLGGGMEYPTLFTCGTSLFPHPRTNRPEGVTVHEFGHQYWYGLSGNNEFEESWLDEGINSYSESRAQYLAYNLGTMAYPHGEKVDLVQTTSFGLLTLAAARGPWLADSGIFSSSRLPGLDLLPLQVQDVVERVQFKGAWIPEAMLLDLMRSQPTATWFREAHFASPWEDRARFLSVDNPDPMVMNGWEYIDRDSYRPNSYPRPATVLTTLERMTGKIRWWAFMREFHARARFAHPTTGDFEDLLGQRLGADVTEFFRKATAGGATFDYGIHEVGDGEVVIRNYGNYSADVKVRVVFVGEEAQPVYETISADSAEDVHRFTYPGKTIAEVWVDPPGGTDLGDGTVEAFEFEGEGAGIYFLDTNLLNNAWRRESDSLPALYRALRLLLEVESELSFAGLIG